MILLRELAASVPTYFFQQVGPFFDIIFCAVRDPKPSIREGAVGAIRAALQVTAQREGKEAQKPQWWVQRRRQWARVEGVCKAWCVMMGEGRG